MKKDEKSLSHRKTREKRYFNPYDNYSIEDYTYNKKMTSLEERRQLKTTGHKQSKQGKQKSSIALERTSKAKVSKKSSSPSSKRRQEQELIQKSSYRKSYPKQTSTRKTHLTTTKTLTPKQRLKIRKQRQRMRVIQMMLAMLLTTLCIWGGATLINHLEKTSVSTQIVQVGKLDTSMTLDGVVIRSEKVVYGQEKGMTQYVVAEGEKVKKDGTVYVLVDESGVNATNTQIQEVEKEIYNKAENSADTANNQDKKYNLAQEVKNNFQEYYNHCFQSNTAAVYTLRSRLESNVASRTDLYVAQQQEKDSDLITQKIELDQALNSYQVGKVAEAPGIVSFQMDGYEREDVAQALSEMDYEKFKTLKKVTTTTQLGQTKLEQGNPIYKLVFSNSWYIVTYINQKQDSFNQGANYELFFPSMNNQSIVFNLIEKQEVEGKIKLVFKTSDQIGQFLSQRSIHFSIGNKNVTGLKIPTSAIVEQNLIVVPMDYTDKDNGSIGVYRKREGRTIFTPLDIVSSDQEKKVYHVLQDLTDSSKIQLNDVLIDKTENSPYQLTQSVVKQGVYVINGKVADFKEIDIIDKSKEYAIVRQSDTSPLREMDKIISNPKGIKNNQLLDEMKVQNSK